jgi:peptidoglycan hydrolase CwlO-like protein
MIQLNNDRKYLSSVINNIHENLAPIQSSMEKIQDDILSTMKQTNSKNIEEINTEYNKIKGEISDGAKLKELIVIMDPKIAKILEKSSTDIPSSISLLKAISELKAELKTYSP